MTTRVVVVGAGGVAQRHVGVLTAMPDVDVVGVVDPVKDAARALAQACGATAYASVSEALDECRPDAAYVCVPPFAHGDPEREVLARGIALFVEKPLSARPDVAEDLARLVARSGVVTGTGYHWRCMDTVDAARARLAASPALLATGYWLDKRPPVGWWPHVDRSGGQVVEQATHVLDVARVLLGEATEVYAAGAIRARDPDQTSGGPPRGDVDDATAATIRFASGTVATLAATSLLRTKHRAGLHTFSEGLVLELTESALAVDDGERRDVVELTEDPRVVVDREFVEAVRGERAGTRAPYEEALRTHRLACAIAESARRAEPVRLDDGRMR